MESISKNTIYDLKMMMKSVLEKIVLESLHAGKRFVTEFVILGKNLSFYEVRENSVCRLEGFQNKYF